MNKWVNWERASGREEGGNIKDQEKEQKGRRSFRYLSLEIIGRMFVSCWEEEGVESREWAEWLAPDKRKVSAMEIRRIVGMLVVTIGCRFTRTEAL